jgi:hypothetical protein
MIVDEQLETIANDLVVIGQKNANSLHTGSPIAANRTLKRKANEDGCASSGGGFNLQGAPNQFDTFPHPKQPQAAPGRRIANDELSVEAVAIVFDDERDEVRAAFEEEADLTSGRMTRDIGQGFLGNAVKGGFVFNGQPLTAQTMRMKVDLHGRLFGPLRGESLQRQLETEVIEGRGAQFPGKPMHIAHKAFGEGFQVNDVVLSLGDGGVLFAKELKAELNCSQFLAEAVVQFT